jgi:uncharacterized protein (TIGR03437 family)
VKQSFRLSRAVKSSNASSLLIACGVAVFVLVLITGALFSSIGTSTTHAQTATPTPTPTLGALPDTFLAQITNAGFISTPTPTATPSASPTPTPSPSPSPSATPTPQFFTTPDTIVDDVSGDGRFVVIESTGNIATESPNNADGNREIFLFDYAQRRIFQITNTKSALLDTTRPANDINNIVVEVSNNRPMISHDGRFIVFSSNAVSASGAMPGNFDGNVFKGELQADGNQEIVLYQLPPVPPVSNLSSGADVPFTDLTKGTFTRITNTPASRPPTPGGNGAPPSTIDDNRNATINDDGSVIAFTSTRNLPTTNNLSNADANPEIFIYNRTSGAFTQITNTQSANIANPIFSDNPSISGDGRTIAFISNANITDTVTKTASNSDNNGEIYIAQVSGGNVTLLRQLTNTTNQANANNVTTNQLLRGRRLSRDGRFIAFESYADLTASGAPIQTGSTVFVVDISSAASASSFTFTQIGPRPTSGGDVQREPTFTGDSRSLVFASALNFRPDGSAPTASDGSDGLNPSRATEIFAVPVPAPSPLAFSRLTPPGKTTSAFQAQISASDTLQRTAFSINGVDYGGGNSSLLGQAFYLLVPNEPVSTATPSSSPTPTPSPDPLSYFTGATLRPVVFTSASPTPSPTALPTPDVAAGGVAPGELVVVRPVDPTATKLAPSAQNAGDATGASLSTSRALPLPIELNGVSVSINNVACGLYFVSPGQINFVVPIGLATTSGTSTYPVVINNNGTIINSSVQIISAQPDIFSSTNGAGGRARVFNVTNPLLGVGTPEPFTVMTTITNPDGTTTTTATVLRVFLTGVRGATVGSITVTVGTTQINGSAIVNVKPTNTPGIDQIDFTLPSTLDKAGDVPISVTVNSVSSRTGAGNAPMILIQ